MAGLRPQAQTGREVSNQPRARGRADLAESLAGDWESCHATGAGDPHRPLWSSGSQEELGGHTEGTGDRADAGGDPPGGSLGSRQGCEDISTRKDTGLVTATGDVTRGAPEPGRTERETPGAVLPPAAALRGAGDPWAVFPGPHSGASPAASPAVRGPGRLAAQKHFACGQASG